MRAIFQAAGPEQTLFAPRPPTATLPGLAWIGSLGERAFGCGRWAGAILAALGISNYRSQIWNLKFAICNPEGHVRSLTRAPLARSVLLRPFYAQGATPAYQGPSYS